MKFNAAFKKWFGESKVVDERGRPLVVYHGASERFSVFNTSVGAFLTPDKEEAMEFGNIVMKVFATIFRPLELSDSQFGFGDRDEEVRIINLAKKHGFDGIFVYKDGDGIRPISYVAFSPTQIKLAKGNDGTFDADDPDIRSNPPKKLWHGTSLRSWKKGGEAGKLYLVSNKQEASSYAFETAGRDEEDGFEPEPVLFEVTLRDLQKSGLELGPDDGGNYKDGMTWEDTLKAWGSMTVEGNVKSLPWKRAKVVSDNPPTIKELQLGLGRAKAAGDKEAAAALRAEIRRLRGGQ